MPSAANLEKILAVFEQPAAVRIAHYEVNRDDGFERVAGRDAKRRKYAARNPRLTKNAPRKIPGQI